MYAKLVYSAGISRTATRYGSCNMIRDIVRLCTSNTPNVNNLIAFSNTSSVIIDTTPAGWSLVYSNGDSTTLPDANTDPNSQSALQEYYWAISAPCLGPGDNNSTLKYAKLTSTYLGNVNTACTAALGFTITGAVSVSNTGTVTGESFRVFLSSTSSTAEARAADFDLGGNGTYHLIATNRHLTIIKETVGFHSIFEHTVSDYHTFYGIAPVLVFNHKGVNSNSADPGTTTSTTPVNGSQATGAPAGSNGPQHSKCLFNITNPNTGTNYSVVQLGDASKTPYLSVRTATSLMRTVASNGITRNLVVPLMVQFMEYGMPTCFITDVCDIYLTGGGIGTTGDTFSIAGTNYTYFDCGTMGLAIGTFG